MTETGPWTCEYDIAPSTTTICQPCGKPTVDGVYCLTHLDVVYKSKPNNSEFLAWWLNRSEAWKQAGEP